MYNSNLRVTAINWWNRLTPDTKATLTNFYSDKNVLDGRDIEKIFVKYNKIKTPIEE